MAFGVISYHLTADVAVPVSVVPLLYAGAMGAAAVGALASGVLYDRAGAAVLLALPVLIAGVPVLALAPSAGLVLAGVLVWGAATGIQDSTVKALVADLVPQPRQGTAYGVFAAFEGAGALVGGALYGSLYGARPALIADGGRTPGGGPGPAPRDAAPGPAVSGPRARQRANLARPDRCRAGMSRDDALVNEEGSRYGAGNQEDAADNPVAPKPAEERQAPAKGLVGDHQHCRDEDKKDHGNHFEHVTLLGVLVDQGRRRTGFLQLLACLCGQECHWHQPQ